ncbi:hypothetical protein RVR_3643 [Actinacidiphila reveromycinica]|uniref:Uncharacterized protein n=1 Tax=Actinacidiphila reveromycinica TaxID=659352 RepID=A0A7U3VNL3_9ACTN|nr:hypothetical protein [Streptomyces sp. SN-593]BBA97749.1 hypothetical protein RVR_3643 [Streptomyces sp. SN-593]
MSDRTALHTAVDRLAGRLRSLPQRRLQGGAAAQALELARWLSAQAEELEFPGRAPHTMPNDGLFVVGDQLAVAGHDLAVALDSAEPGRAAAVAASALERVASAARSIG